MSETLAHFQLSHILLGSEYMRMKLGPWRFMLPEEGLRNVTGKSNFFPKISVRVPGIIQSNSSLYNRSLLFIYRKGQSKESEDVEYHNVFIYKNPKLQRLADGLQKFDRIYLSGFVNYSTKMYEDGSEHENGFIQPINLVKLQKFNE